VPGFEIRELRAGELDRLEPLWCELLAHHGAVTPTMPPTVAPAESWRIRRGLYEQWLGEPGSFALVADGGDSLLGYALVEVRPADDTWQMGERLAELQTLVVATSARGAGIGSTLMDEVERRLRAAGINDLLVGVVMSNSQALEFYRRRGLEPYMAQLYARLPDRPREPDA
jgi:ribosomal protein S18 acetylase RimI-like enzyme